MKLKFYKKCILILSLALSIASSNLQAQNQGLYADTIKWPNSNAITVNLRASGFTNVINFQGTIKWDKNSLQYVSTTINPILVAPASPQGSISFGTSTAVSQGILTYLYTDTGNHTLSNGSVVFSINFNIINNPVSTYKDNVIYFSNSPTPIGIDTVTDTQGLSDLGSLTSPNSENHIGSYVSFARPPVLSYAGGNVTDSITNRPVGCTYQWTVDGNNDPGTTISTFNNTPPGVICLSITYPNSTTVTCTAGGGTVTPVKLTSFAGKIVDSKVVLIWSTFNEINNKGFAIEKSIDGNTFTQISFVNADNSTASQHQYSYADVYTNKTVWYRLKQVDNNGKFSYSNAIRIATTSKDLISVYPNPTKNFVKIEGNKIANVSISNILGKVVLQKDFDGVSSTTLDIATLAQGVYVVNVKTATTKTVSKLIVE